MGSKYLEIIGHNIFATLAFSILLVMDSCGNNIINNDCESVIISKVGDQNIFINSTTYIPLAALANDLDDLEFEVVEGPAFLSFRHTNRGRAELVLTPSKDDEGSYHVAIGVHNKDLYGCTTFNIDVINPNKGSEIIHCDPLSTNGGDGSLEKPYGSLSRLLGNGYKPRPNDHFILHSGNHGDVTLFGSDYVISAASNAQARFTQMNILDAHRVVISGIIVQPSEEAGNHHKYAVFIDSLSSYIDFVNNKIYGGLDSENWTVAEWRQKAIRGIKCRATQARIMHNLIQNVYHGIKTEGDSILVHYNHVDRFSGDAIRNTGSYNTYEYNFLTNATIDDYYDDGGNHDDLFQSWTFDEDIVGIRLSNNVMVSCVDTLMPLRAKIVQGLVCFDGFEKDWQVDNNTIITDHPHGIALYGATNCRIFNNTILRNPHQLYQFESDPWIMINNHKDGRKSIDNIVRDNISTTLNIVSDDVKQSSNIIIDSLSYNKLNNYDEWDFRIKK